MKTGLTLKEHSTLLSITLRIIDLIALLLAGLTSYWIRFSNLELDLTYRNVLLLGLLFGAASLSFFGAYRAWRGATFTSEVKCVLSATMTTFVLLILSGFVTQSSDLFSRIWVVTWLITTTITILSYRLVLRKTLGSLRSRGFNIRSVVVIGDGELAIKVIERLHQHPEMGLMVRGIISTTESVTINNRFFSQTQLLGSLRDLNNIVKSQEIDQVWIALPLSEVTQMEQVQSVLATSAVTIRMVPDIYGFQLINHSMTEVAGLPVINLSTSHMLEGKNRFLKSLEDKVLSLLILIGIGPILLMLAIGVKLSSPGPVFYRQERVSWNGRAFDMLKFRSMAVDSEKNGVKWGGATTMSVTKFGAFIRKTSLDELPQFINVLKGDMSIVGPRPERTVFVEQFKHEIPGYMQKHMVKAGITGWAQVSGWRGDTDLKKRIEYDLYYIEHWSLWFDLRIIFLTIFKGFIHKNAV